MRKILAALLSVTILLGLSACKQNSDTPSTTEGSVSNSTGATSSTGESVPSEPATPNGTTATQGTSGTTPTTSTAPVGTQPATEAPPAAGNTETTAPATQATKPALTVKATKTSVQADSVHMKDGYGVLTQFDEWGTPVKGAIIDTRGETVFGTVNIDDFTRLKMDNGLVVWQGSVYRLDGTQAFSFDEILPDEKVTAFFAEVENDPFYDSVDRFISYQVENIGNGIMTVRRNCWCSTVAGATGGGVRGPYEYFLVSTEGKWLKTLPEHFNEVIGLGGYYNSYIGQVGGAGDNGLLWFWHWDELTGHIDNLESSTFDIEEYYNGGHFWPAGYMDMEGNIVVPAIYNSVWAFSEGLAAVKNQAGRVGFIDSTNATVIPFDYEDAVSFYDGYAAVKKDGKWGYVDKNGNTVIPFEYDDAFGAGNRLFTVGKNGKYGIVDNGNRIVVPLEYDDISSVENGIAYGIKNGDVYVIEIQF